MARAEVEVKRAEPVETRLYSPAMALAVLEVRKPPLRGGAAGAIVVTRSRPANRFLDAMVLGPCPWFSPELTGRRLAPIGPPCNNTRARSNLTASKVNATAPPRSLNANVRATRKSPMELI